MFPSSNHTEEHKIYKEDGRYKMTDIDCITKMKKIKSLRQNKDI